MDYDELMEVMEAYHLGHVTRLELLAAFELWQRRYFR